MLQFRVATLDDAARLFEWRNDPLTRVMSRSAELVQWDQHVTWLDNRLSRPNPDLYIVELDQRPVATFRLDGDEVSFTVAPEERGKGIASGMLVMIREKYGPLRAEIYMRNIASIKVATAAGMRVVLLAE